MIRKTYIQIDPTNSIELPEEFQNDDVRYSDAFVEYFLEEFTKPGDVVLDPFSGFGTTLLVCERMDRMGYGIEIDQDRVGFSRSLLKHPERLIHGDSRHLSEYDFPHADFSITSPPYRTKIHKLDPLSGYKSAGGQYSEYLIDMQSIYAQLANRLKPGAHVVVSVSNLDTEQGFTPLAWDIGTAIGEELTFLGERIILGEPNHYGYDHSYALVFKAN